MIAQKPPLGIKPKKIWMLHRIQDLNNTIALYIQACKFDHTTLDLLTELTSLVCDLIELNDIPELRDLE